MNSDTGFSCHQLDKDDVYQIDNSKSSCALFMIQGQVNLDLGEFYEGEMEQGQADSKRSFILEKWTGIHIG